MDIEVQVAAGVRLSQMLQSDGGVIVQLFPIGYIQQLEVVCAAVALRDAGIQSGMSLAKIEVVGVAGSRREIRLSEDGINGNWKHPRVLTFKAVTWRKAANAWAPWPSTTTVFTVSQQAPGRKGAKGFSIPKERSVTLTDYRIVVKKKRDARAVKGMFILTEQTVCEVDHSPRNREEGISVLLVSSAFSGSLQLEGPTNLVDRWKTLVDDCIAKCKSPVDASPSQSLTPTLNAVRADVRVFQAKATRLSHYGNVGRGKHFVRVLSRALELSKDAAFGAADSKDQRLLPLTVDCSVGLLGDGVTLEIYLGDTGAHMTLACANRADARQLYQNILLSLQSATARFRAPYEWFSKATKPIQFDASSGAGAKSKALFFSPGPAVSLMWEAGMWVRDIPTPVGPSSAAQAKAAAAVMAAEGSPTSGALFRPSPIQQDHATNLRQSSPGTADSTTKIVKKRSFRSGSSRNGFMSVEGELTFVTAGLVIGRDGGIRHNLTISPLTPAALAEWMLLHQEEPRVLTFAPDEADSRVFCRGLQIRDLQDVVQLPGEGWVEAVAQVNGRAAYLALVQQDLVLFSSDKKDEELLRVPLVAGVSVLLGIDDVSLGVLAPARSGEQRAVLEFKAQHSASMSASDWRKAIDVAVMDVVAVKAASTAADAEAAAAAKIGFMKSPHESTHSIPGRTLSDDESESSGGDSAVAQELIQLGSMYLRTSDSPDLLDGVEFQQVSEVASAANVLQVTESANNDNTSAQAGTPTSSRLETKSQDEPVKMDDGVESSKIFEDEPAADVNSTIDVDHTWGESFVEFSSAVEVSPESSDRVGGAQPHEEATVDENSSDGEQGEILSKHDETPPPSTPVSSENRIASAISQVQERWRQTRERAAREARAATLEELTTVDTGRDSISTADRDHAKYRMESGSETPPSPKKQPGTPPNGEGRSAGSIENGKSFSSLNINVSPSEPSSVPLQRQLSDEEIEELRLWHEDNPDSNDAVLMLQRHWRRRKGHANSSRTQDSENEAGDVLICTPHFDAATPRNGAMTPPGSPGSPTPGTPESERAESFKDLTHVEATDGKAPVVQSRNSVNDADRVSDGRSRRSTSTTRDYTLSPFMLRLQAFRQHHCPQSSVDEILDTFAAEHGIGKDPADGDGEFFFDWLRRWYNIQLPDYYPAVKTTMEEFYRSIGKRKAVASVPVLLEQFCTIELLRVLEQKLQRYSGNSQGVEVPRIYDIAVTENDRLTQMRIDVFADSYRVGWLSVFDAEISTYLARTDELSSLNQPVREFDKACFQGFTEMRSLMNQIVSKKSCRLVLCALKRRSLKIYKVSPKTSRGILLASVPLVVGMQPEVRDANQNAFRLLVDQAGEAFGQGSLEFMAANKRECSAWVEALQSCLSNVARDEERRARSEAKQAKKRDEQEALARRHAFPGDQGRHASHLDFVATHDGPDIMADAEMYPSSDDDNDGTSHHDSGASDVDAFSQWHSDPSNGLLNKDHKRTATDFGNGDGYFESKANGTDASHSDSAAVTLALRGAPNVASFAKATCHGLRGAVDYIAARTEAGVIDKEPLDTNICRTFAEDDIYGQTLREVFSSLGLFFSRNGTLRIVGMGRAAERLKAAIARVRVLGQSPEGVNTNEFKNATAEYRRLSKQEHPLDPKGLCSVMRRIVDSPSLKLTTVALVDCNLGNHGLELLMTFLPTSRIKSVDLKRNGITVEGAKVIATSLTATQKGGSRLSAKAGTPKTKPLRLEHLDLGYNRVGDAGFLHIMAALLGVENPGGDFSLSLARFEHQRRTREQSTGGRERKRKLRLRHVSLCNNLVTDTGCQRVAMLLGRWAEAKSPAVALRVLDLSQNNVGPDGGRQLANMTSRYLDLVLLDLSENLLSKTQDSRDAVLSAAARTVKGRGGSVGLIKV